MKYAIVAIVSMLLITFAIAPPATAQPGAPDQNLYLRRATFDPLRAPQISAAPDTDPSSGLLLVQFDSVPTAETRARLAAAGYRPLLYVPSNALLVRAVGARTQSLAELPALRWTGAFQSAYKLPSSLDAALTGQTAGQLELRLIATPDADADLLVRALEAAGGVLKNRADSLNGAVLRVILPAPALRAMLDRDDVLWVEPAFTLTLANDRARTILGVTSAAERLGWLTGSGQLVAVTDTGLDVQQTVEANGNPDFLSNRIAAGFGPAQMSNTCADLQNGANWSDKNGHGTHVAGTALGGGRPPAMPSLAGMASGARLVVQAVSSGGSTLDCLDEDSSFLAKAYSAGARIQNGSWGQPTGSGVSDQYGSYTAFEQIVDEFLWNHKQHLFVVVAGNGGFDAKSPAGVTDPDSIDSPGTAKNVVTVGSSENNRPPTSSTCGSFGGSGKQENQCYGIYGKAPIASDFVSDNVDGLAAFSGRGPADDGRIKPEIVAPGTNIVSTASHATGAFYPYGKYNADYAYDNGTSMSAPMISGLAALTRQWLTEARHLTAPSAALVKALLLNGARDLSPGQYGTGAQREIPQAWPNNAEGWGRAAITNTIALNGNQSIWLVDDSAGLPQGGSATYSLNVSAGAPLRISIAWTDYPASPISSRTLVNDLDLEVQPPSGPLLRGNASADLPANCRDATSGADRCDNVESLEIATPEAGVYTVRVRGAVVPQGPQPFALVARAREIGDAALGAPALEPIGGAGPLLSLSWSAIAGATFYQVEQSTSSDFAVPTDIRTTVSASMGIVADKGTYWFRVRACTSAGCGAASNVQSATVASAPKRRYLQIVLN
ncbi:MAG TPA: S8 family serine peptidase [Roseiflexaceae bacterium]|nr:S8 family serine peptidase [Roseiflexaceae bacterium]